MYARISAWTLALALVLTAHATAQERFGTLQGRVTDQQSAPIPGVTVDGDEPHVRRGAHLRHRCQRTVRGVGPQSRPLQGELRAVRIHQDRAARRQRRARAHVRGGHRRCASAASTETVQVTADASPLVDNRSTLIAHNVSAEEFDRLPKGRSFQSIALTAPSVNSGEVEGGFQVNGASGAENALHRRRHHHQLADQRPVAPEHRLRVPAGSAGQDERHLGRIRRRARRRDQRRDQERRQRVPRRRPLLLRGQRARGRPGEAAGARSDDRGHRRSTCRTTRTTNRQSEFGGSIGGPIVKNRLFFFGAYSPRVEKRDNLYNFTDGTSTFEQRTSGASRRSAS